MSNKKQPSNSSSDYRDALSTVSAEGKRIWVYPKKQKGKLYSRRSIVAGILLLLFFVGPFIKYNGEPIMLFNVLKREFIIFGMPFSPQDAFLFAVSMITLLVVIVLFTAVFGRLFCGWLCPQTIFMEHIFRRIEYAIEGDANRSRRLDQGPWTNEKKWKKGLKWTIFYLLSFIIANYFLAYMIGIDELWELAKDPMGHLGGLVGILVFSFAFFMVFANIRDQVCTTICPYGRLQGVLLDRNSIVVTYDFERGEPRGAKKKKKSKIALADSNTAAFVGEKDGDCVDCDLCVKVCPTGIDIRNGTQLECINCTLCMDACDSIMDKVKKPQGLIRYASYNSIVNHQPNKVFTTRSIAYSAVMVVLLGFLGYVMSSRVMVKTLIQNARGTLYMEVDKDHGKNLFSYQLINKTRDEIDIELKIIDKDGELTLVGSQDLKVPPKEMVEGAFFITLDNKDMTGKQTEVKIGVFHDGKKIDECEIGFLGPAK